MKTSIIKTIAVPVVLLATFTTIAQAQKLPNVQQKSMRAPETVKVDGKATEWDDSFQAFNHATDIYYTMANDDKNLYLVVQATDKQVINKIIGGGVALTIQKSGKKNDKDGITITYPVFDPKDRPYARSGGGMVARMTVFGGSGGGGGTPVMDIQKTPDAGPAKAASPTEGDSIMMVS